MSKPVWQRPSDNDFESDQPRLSSAVSLRALSGAAALSRQRAMSAMLKVPEITVLFWIIKLLTTAMGESTTDYLVFQINPYVAVALGCLGLVVALILQLWVRRYIPWVYWLAIVMVAIFGTMAADVAHVVLGIRYEVSAACFAAALVLIFVIWYASEKTLSIHSITRGRRELFYWATDRKSVV